MTKAKEELDLRDRRLLHAIWLNVVNALERNRHGHTDGWTNVQKSLDEAEDEMGPPEDFEP